MRKQNKIFIWSVYFDSNKTRTDGRRVPKNLAVSNPKLEEIERATKRLGLQPEVISDAVYPRCPWRRTGLIILPKTESKCKTLEKVAKELSTLRR